MMKILKMKVKYYFLMSKSSKRLLLLSKILLYDVSRHCCFFIILCFAYPAVYNTGETVTTYHQNIDFPVCYGDYESNSLSLADFNGDLNGGDYKVIFIDMSATW